MPTERFAFAFDRRFVPVLACLGIRRRNSDVVLSDDALDIRFGRWRLRTPVDNLRDVQITSGYRWFKAVGPRGSMVDHGVTFGTNAETGVCVCFHEPVGALLGDRLLHPAATVTVADPQGFAAAVRRRLDESPASDRS